MKLLGTLQGILKVRRVFSGTHWEECMRIIVPVTMFGSVPMPCFVHARCIGKGLYYLLYWSQYLVTFPRNLVSSCCFFLSFHRTSAEKGW